MADFVDEAVRARARSAQARGERILRRLGVRMQGRWLVRRPERPSDATLAEAEAAP